MKDHNDRNAQGAKVPSEAEDVGASASRSLAELLKTSAQSHAGSTHHINLKIAGDLLSTDPATERGQLALSTVGLLTTQSAALPLWLLRFFQNTLTLAPNLELLPASSEEDRRKALLWINDRADREGVSDKDDAALTLHVASDNCREVLPADVIQLAASLLTAALAEGVKEVAADE